MPLSKQALVVKNNTNFPNNNTGYITPALLREFNTDMIDAMQLTQSMSEYAVLSGSNTFIGNQTMTGNLNVSGVISASVLHVQYETASVIFSTGSNQLGDELTDIQTLSGSVKIQGQLLINGIPLSSGSATVDTGSLVTTASFNAYTSSNNQRVSSLETNSASVNISIANINTTTASLNTSITNLNAFSSSQKGLNGTFATTGSNTFTGNQVIDRASKLYTNGIYWTDVTAGFNNLEIINQGGGNLDFASLNGGRMRVVSTPLQLTGSALSSNSDISTSANVYGANLTASAIPAGTISSSAQITSLGFVSSSVTASSLITASFDNGTRNLTFTKGDASTFNVNIPDVSGSTGNFATTGSNTFIGNQTISGSLFVSGSEVLRGTLSASALRVENNTYLDGTLTVTNDTLINGDVTIQSATPNLKLRDTSGGGFSSGYDLRVDTGSFEIYDDTHNRDVLSDFFNSGSQKHTTSLTSEIIVISGSTSVTLIGNVSASIISASTINGLGDPLAFSQSVDSRLDNLESTSASLLIETQNLELFSASALTSLSNLNTATASLFTSTSLSLTTASFSGNTLTFTKGNGTTFGVVIPDVSGSTINTGSFATTGSNSFNGNQTITGSITSTQDITVSSVKFGFGNPAGTSSIAIGNSNTLQNNTYDNNIAIGNDALQQNTIGSRNIGIGTQALKSITGNSNYNVGIGGFALSAATSSTNTFALGYSAMESAVDSNENIAIGVAALANKKANSNSNTAIGSHALREHRDGDTHGGQNMAFGYDAMRNVTSGSGNTAIGPAALRDAPRANENVFIGMIAGYNAGHVDYNTVIGARAGNAIKNSYNTIIGHQAGDNISSGSSNTIIGKGAGANVGSGSTNTFIGIYAGANISGSNNTLIGAAKGIGNWSNVIALSDGAENIRAIYNSGWVFTGSVDIQNTLTASLQQGYVWVGGVGNVSKLVATSSFGGTTNTGSLMLTGSIAGNILTFTKGDASTFNLTIPSATGSVFDTGSFATTGSNTFNGDQSITGSVSVFLPKASGKQFKVDWGNAGSASMFTEESGGPNQSLILVSASIDLRGGGGIDFVSGNIRNSGNEIQFNALPSASFVLRTQNGGDAEIRGNTDYVDTNRPFSFVRAGSTGNITLTGFGGGITLSGSSTNIQGFTYPNTDGTSGQVLTTNGSKVLSFTTISGGGTAFANPSVESISGSLLLTANTFTSGAANLTHLSASAQNQANLVFKNNNNTGTTIISGSNNLFVNAAAPTTGFKRYIGGSGNIILNASNVPQISGSMAFSPTMNNNYFGGNSTTLIARGPVSSSTYTISANNVLGTINIGSSAALNAEKLTSGLSMQQNSVAGTLTIVANQSALTGSTTTVSSNTINGVVVLNLSSSAVSFQQSNINDGNFIFTNQFSSGALGIGLVSISNNTIGGFSNTLIVTGSVLTGSLQPSIFNNLVIGATNTGFINTSDSRISGSNVYQNLLATSLLGNRLIVTGSSLATDLNSFGSLFVGRWNANDGIKNKTSDVIFAVGTGISGSGTTGRKTGFLIDSGSNTFIEGTLNVSGSTTMTGSLILSSSNAVELFVIGESQFTGSVKVASTFQLQLPTGSNQQAGTAVLDGANPGTVTVSNSLVTANSIILLTKQTLAHTNGYVAVSAKSGGTFTITSNHNGDTDTVGWFIINNS